MLIRGDLDSVVPVEHSPKVSAALKAHDKEVEYIQSAKAK